jgi:O-antigen ligase
LAWTTTQSETGAELDRMLLYLAGALAVVTIVGVERVTRLLAGVLTGVTLVCLYALSTRLFPRSTGVEGFAASRLNTPIGYWNGLGVLAAMGVMLALVFAARARTGVWRGLAAAAVPVLVLTLYFTFSRGAWIALFAGVVVLFAADRERLQLLGAGVVPGVLGAFVVWRASQQDALTHTSASTLQTAVHQGRGLAAVLAATCLVAGYVGWAMRRLDPIWKRREVARVAGWLVVVAAVLVAAALVARFGSPVSMAKRGYDSFVGAPTGGANLNSRLFSLSNDGRLPAWKVAMHGFSAHPLTGLGAGGFENYWNQHRTVDMKIRDAHSFYVETLSEEGIIGSLLIFGALAMPLLALRRARRHPLAAGALAAFMVLLVHWIADWDWELSGVTLVGLFCGASLLVIGRRARPAGAVRWPVLAVAVLVGLVALAGLAGRLSLNASGSATKVSDSSRAISDARLAHRLMPWSGEAWAALGAAQLSAGERADAVVSYEKAAAKSPGDYRVWIALAKAKTGPTRWHDLAKALHLNPLGADETRTIAMQLLNPNPGATP